MAYLAAPDLYDPPDAGLVQVLTLVKAARWQGVAPWELAAQPAWWLDIIQTAMDVEQAVHEKQRSKADGAGN